MVHHTDPETWDRDICCDCDDDKTVENPDLKSDQGNSCAHYLLVSNRIGKIAGEIFKPYPKNIPIQVADLQKHYDHKSGEIKNPQMEYYQYIHNNGPYIWIPVGSHQQ